MHVVEERMDEGKFSRSTRIRSPRVILIGASTGGVDALLRVLSHFSEKCPPTFIVQHTGGNFTNSLIRLLDSATDARVCGAQNGMAVEKGKIYLSPSDRVHLTIETEDVPKVALCATAPVLGHRPSVDALFFSAVPIAPRVTAALLTGMGCDGAAGIEALNTAGADTFGQDETTSLIYGMPRKAKELGGIQVELPINDIGPALLKSAQTKVCST